MKPLARASRTRSARRFASSLRNRPAGLCHAVVAAPLIVEFRRRTFLHFFDQVIVDHALNGSIERARAQPDIAVRPGEHILDDGVTVAIFVGERQQDVEDRRLQHHLTISIVDIPSMDIDEAGRPKVCGRLLPR